jgi:hypothetical protein
MEMDNAEKAGPSTRKWPRRTEFYNNKERVKGLLIKKYIRRILSSLPLFLVVFVVISISADISFLSRKTSSAEGKDGWTGMADFQVFRRAGNVMRADINDDEESSYIDEPLFDRNEPFYHFRYSPAAAIAMVPLSLIPSPRTAMFTWLLLGNIAFLAALIIMAAHLKKTALIEGSARTPMLWFMFLGTLRYYLMVILQGQTDGLAALLLVLTVVALFRGRDVLAGVLFAAILQIKPYFAIFALYFLVDRRYKAILSLCGSLLFFAVLPAFFLGARQTLTLSKDWVFMLRTSVASQVMNYKNQSLSYGTAVAVSKVSDIWRLATPHSVIYSLSMVFQGISLAALFLFLRRHSVKADRFLGYVTISAMIFIALVFSPISWEAYYASLIIPLAVFFALGIERQREKAMACYAAGYFVLVHIVGTDITKFVPVLNRMRFTNISLASLVLLWGMFDLYMNRRIDISVRSGHTRGKG